MNRHADQTARSLSTTEGREGSALCTLHFVGAILALIGFFGPWVAHQTASLTVTGYELSEFAKFFPQVQGGVVPVKRALFITPLLGGIVCLALVINRSANGPLLRLASTALVALLGLGALPPFDGLLEPQYRLQLWLVVAGTLLVVSTPLARRLSEQSHGVLLLLFSLGGIAPALWQALLLHPLITELYRRPVWPGWGLAVCAIGFLMVGAGSVRRIVKK